MNINEQFPSKWLKAADLQNRRVTVEIDHVLLENMEGDGGSKPVLYFRGKQKGLVINKTNAAAIAMLYGDETDGWTGKTIELFSVMTQYNGQNMPGIWVGAPQGAGNSTQPPQHTQPIDVGDTEMLEDEIPF